MVMASAWFLYCRESKSLNIDEPMHMKDSQVQAATSLVSWEGNSRSSISGVSVTSQETSSTA